MPIIVLCAPSVWTCSLRKTDNYDKDNPVIKTHFLGYLRSSKSLILCSFSNCKYTVKRKDQAHGRFYGQSASEVLIWHLLIFFKVAFLAWKRYVLLMGDFIQIFNFQCFFDQEPNYELGPTGFSSTPTLFQKDRHFDKYFCIIFFSEPLSKKLARLPAINLIGSSFATHYVPDLSLKTSQVKFSASLLSLLCSWQKIALRRYGILY